MNPQRLVDFLTDTETSLLHRDFFAMRLDEEFKKSWRHGWNLSLLLFDVEGLTRIEEDEGARAQASAILDISGELLSASRDTDLSSRLGPQRFAVALPGADAAGAHAFVERVLRAIEEGSFGRLTLYVGGTSMPQDDLGSCQEFLNRAEAGLEMARERGSGEFVLWSAPPPTS